jgi:DNA-binding CsgD family transcriptional regulator
MLLHRQAEISEARAELDRLVKTYRSGPRTRDPEELVEIVTGAEPLAQRVSQLQHSPRSEFAGFVKPPFVAVDLGHAEPLRDPGVWWRVVYDRDITGYDNFVTELRRNTAPRVEYRVHSNLPMKLLVADRQTALLPLGRDSTDTTPAAVIVHSSGLVDALMALFEHYWEASTPLALGETGPGGLAAGGLPAGGDHRILSMLVAGVTDQAIARQLDISLRTVRRRIQAMMRAAGAANRAQLAWHAARNNWL